MAFAQTADGWTDITPVTGSADPADDSVLIYVSSASGNDANDGLSEENPVATITEGLSLMRAGKPDHLLLERGGTWNEILTPPTGASSAAPAIVRPYGTGDRPIMQDRVLHIGTTQRGYWIITGLKFNNAAALEDQPGFRIIAPTTCAVIEDCDISGYVSGIVFDPEEGDNSGNEVRRNIIHGNTPAASGVGAHSQGIFINGVTGFLIEENLIFQNGHSGDRSDSTVFNHNMYLRGCDTGLVVRGNIIADGSSHGISCNPPATIENNLVVKAPIGIFCRTNGTTARNNVVAESVDINVSTTRGFGIIVGDQWEWDFGATLIQSNLLLNNNATGNAPALEVQGISNGGSSPLEVTLDANVVVGWGSTSLWARGALTTHLARLTATNNIFDEGASSVTMVNVLDTLPLDDLYEFSGNQYVTGDTTPFLGNATQYSLAQWQAGPEADASTYTDGFTNRGATVADYAASLSGGDGFDQFVTKAMANSRNSWDTDYTALAAVNYLRAAHDMAAVSSPSEDPSTFLALSVGGSFLVIGA